MEKSQLSIFNIETFTRLEVSVDSLMSYIEEVAWAIDICEQGLESKEATKFYSSMVKIRNLSKNMQAELLEYFCKLTLDNKSDDLPHKQIFTSALYEEYFLLRRSVNSFVLEQN